VTLQDLGSLGELIAAIATIATLVYLAIQIRQNTRAVEAAAFQSGVDGINHLNSLLAHDESMARIIRLGNETMDNLTEDEKVRYSFIYLSGFRSFESMHFHHLNGTGKGLWVSHGQHIGTHLNYLGVRQWWEENQLAFTPEFTEFVEQKLAEVKSDAANN
jgi:hypothetical protein